MPLPVPTPETPVRPDELRPPCPGCPDPDNAGRVDKPCPGPEIIKDPSEEAALVDLCQALGAPACADMIFCPRTGGSRINQ